MPEEAGQRCRLFYALVAHLDDSKETIIQPFFFVALFLPRVVLVAGVTHLSDAHAEALAKFKGCLVLDGLTSLSRA